MLGLGLGFIANTTLDRKRANANGDPCFGCTLPSRLTHIPNKGRNHSLLCSGFFGGQILGFTFARLSLTAHDLPHNALSLNRIQAVFHYFFFYS
jgi:hypothetical protein